MGVLYYESSLDDMFVSIPKHTEAFKAFHKFATRSQLGIGDLGTHAPWGQLIL